MNGHATVKALLVIGGGALLAGGCSGSDSPVEPTPVATSLVSVVPRGGSTDVDRFAPVVLGFDHAMGVGMEAFVRLHLGDVTGPVVAGVWRMSADRRVLTFTPEAPLAPDSRYTIHVGGGMMDSDGGLVDIGDHGQQMGGTWTGMMGGGAMGGEHMGQGWRHPTNGGYGMVFSFTTGR